ncbi:MAG: PEP-CTERM sorting domain-containing protein [Pseudomonadota bacterium]
MTLQRITATLSLGSLLAALIASVPTVQGAVLFEQLPTRSGTDTDYNYNHRSSESNRYEDDYTYTYFRDNKSGSDTSYRYRFTRDAYGFQRTHLDDFTPGKDWQLTDGETWGFAQDQYEQQYTRDGGHYQDTYLPWDGAVEWAIYSDPTDFSTPLYVGVDTAATRSVDQNAGRCPVGSSCGSTGYHYQFSFGDNVFLDAGSTFWISINAYERREYSQAGRRTGSYSCYYYYYCSYNYVRYTYDYIAGKNDDTYARFEQALSSTSGNATRVDHTEANSYSYDYSYGGTDRAYSSPASTYSYQNQGALAFRLSGTALGGVAASTSTAPEPGTALIIGAGLLMALRRRRRQARPARRRGAPYSEAVCRTRAKRPWPRSLGFPNKAHC